jgi:ectoine hydroxylase-related dioxygenase (phytanoyl-CoA dioxygenase family)
LEQRRQKMATAKTSTELTPEQATYFETFGYVVLRGLFSPEEMAGIREDYDDVMDEDREGKPFSGPKRQQVMAICEMRPRLFQLIDDSRIYHPIQQLLGESFVYLGSDATLFVGSKSWHPDGSPRDQAEFDYIRIKVAFYLDPLRSETGCLRVIPGSHKKPFHDTIMPQMTDGKSNPFGVTMEALPAAPLETDPGDVIFFDQNTWHASVGGGAGRRQMTLNFANQPTSNAHIDYLKWTYQGAFEHMRGWSHTQRDQLHTDALLNSDRPRIQRMIAKKLELGLR